MHAIMSLNGIDCPSMKDLILHIHNIHSILSAVSEEDLILRIHNIHSILSAVSEKDFILHILNIHSILSAVSEILPKVVCLHVSSFCIHIY